MPQKLNGLFTELTRKKAYYEDQIKKIDAVLTSLRGIDGIQEEPTQVWVKETTPSKIKYMQGKLHPYDFVRDYIRHKGKEVRMKELFAEYFQTTNQVMPTNPKEKQRKYNIFSSYFATARIKKHGFIRKLYKLEGIGQEVYINVDSAIKLQTGKVEQAPHNVIKEIV